MNLKHLFVVFVCVVSIRALTLMHSIHGDVSLPDSLL